MKTPTSLPLILLLTSLAACRELPAEATPPPPIDPGATAETRHLLASLHRIGWSDQFAFGQEFPLSYNFAMDDGHEHDPTTSDVKDVVGDHPGVHGSDFHYIVDKPAREARRHLAAARAAYAAGAIVTFDYHWLGRYGRSHTAHPRDNQILGRVVAGDDSQGDVTWFYRHLDRVLDIVNDDLGFPIVFRPFHEMDGEWFWWGNHVGAEVYREAYRLLVDYMRERTDLVLFCWSPDVKEPDLELYYPGDDYVDMIGRDIYWFGSEEREGRSVEALVEVIDFARARGKVAAFTETGYSAGGVSFEDEAPDWWSATVLPELKSHPRGLHIAWILTWINASWSGPYVPHAASPEAAKESFRAFHADPATLFEKDVRALDVYAPQPSAGE
ncbi:MAG: glycoside hydrolase family 26 protein [Opitutales bacterium]